jgi:hypothetical protein
MLRIGREWELDDFEGNEVVAEVGLEERIQRAVSSEGPTAMIPQEDHSPASPEQFKVPRRSIVRSDRVLRIFRDLSSSEEWEMHDSASGQPTAGFGYAR